MVIPTLNRPEVIAPLLSTLLTQTTPALEILVIDDSKDMSTYEAVFRLTPKFESLRTKIVYLRGNGDGITAARNLGISASSGEAILFLDDDTLLDRNVIAGITDFLQENPEAMGVQPKVPGFADYWAKPNFGIRLENYVNQVAMLTYHKPNVLSVRRSGAAVFPANLTKVIPAQRLMGCCFCLRRSALSGISFDTNLKKWGCYEDLDVTYRVNRKYPGSLFAIPSVSVIHKHSNRSRLPPRSLRRMATVYWFYVFLKDFSSESILNTLAFMWAMLGALFWTVVAAFMNRDGKRLEETRYLLHDCAESLWHLRAIRKGNLDFFNRTLR